MGLLDEISAYLHTAGVGTLATDIFLGSIPDSPDNCIVLIESGGSPPDRTFGGGNADNEDVRLQVITRNLDYSAGRVKIANVVTALDGIIRSEEHTSELQSRQYLV